MNDNTSTLFSADEVIAPGKFPQYMQLPSPVYFVRWVDDHHAIIGAGGGGRRFGMVNFLALISVDTTQQLCEAPSGKKPQVQLPQKDPPPPPHPWKFVTAIDLERDIPWCASTFVVCTDAAELARGVVGHLAVSHITCFTLVEVYQCCKTNSLAMRRRACIAVPSDTKNPDKKPIALVQGTLVVAHDEGGVQVYSLHSLLQRVQSPEEEQGIRRKVETNTKTQNASPAASVYGEEQHAVVETPGIIREAEPLAVWSLPARLNDLHANRFFVPKKGNGREKSGMRPHSDYLLIVALVQDKTLRLATMKLSRRTSAIDKEGNKNVNGHTITHLVDACMFTGKDCHISFPLMKSSMRLVQIFGVEDVTPTKAEESWMEARRLHCETGIRGTMPIASFIVVVYDVLGNHSCMLTARVSSTAAAASRDALSKDSETVTNDAKKPSRQLKLQVCFAPQPSPLINEGVTSVSACHYRGRCNDCNALNGEGVGTNLPSHWLAGTVEGTILSLLYTGEGRFQTLSIRPSKSKREAARFPALHREPISCVAVSKQNDVLTTDIAQNVVVSVLPLCQGSTMNPALSESRGHCLAKVDGAVTRAAGAAVTEVEDLTSFANDGRELAVQPKCVALSLFPSGQRSKPSLLSPLGYTAILSAGLLAVAVVALLMAMLVAYWLS
ncbi:hypothetical protein TraAM80_05545 [Trypanosoma rangeli]|uniref:Uncharacterized protein n=1 Tax=Trypanosoma rangeli TaxID=5698 RepID=A0A422NEG1_TRYRA|nr:uncharacterized protein TraAM80_05545 [Trypanosoma rangeli]RNF03849.1 hypothetical protein TraAM80_05545 [Trypanosoma rangeli]|eukprot:RNF03849.1 hypothetical protein TraAM80_05545 [Trypanosoma rangeli]